MTWERRQGVALSERWDGVPVVVGFEAERDCGCRYRTGLRVDRPTPGERFPFEPVFGAWPCPTHPDENERAMAAFQTLPPSVERVNDLWERLLDDEVGG